MNWWPAVVFGWPAILLVLVLAVVGVARRNWSITAGSVIVSTPFSFYLASAPGSRWLGVAIPLLLIATTGAIRYQWSELSWLLLILVVASIGWIAIAVVTQ